LLPKYDAEIAKLGRVLGLKAPFRRRHSPAIKATFGTKVNLKIKADKELSMLKITQDRD
jgi:hypothetical protein